MPRMIGDFDDNANVMWSLHVGEAKCHDEARIHSLKDDMDSVLIFVRIHIFPSSSFSRSSCTVVQAGLFSAALTSFLVDSAHSLRVDPAQQMVFYQQQNVALLVQISKQLSSITPQISIPSTPLPSYHFSPNASDVRVNAFWAMSLVFSLSAALLATLVQQWVRDYMHVFQRYSNPLKSARLRQYLFEGVERWYMPRMARSVPGLVHVSLFLFFIGLGDTLLALNTTVGVTTIVPITICGLLYVLSMFASAINPQSPFQNPFSGLIWYLKQKVHPRRYLDRASGGSLKVVSSSLAEAQMQLAMEENDERKDRDIQAIQWLIQNRTEDDEMESFAMAIPGCFTSQWGIDVWRTVSEARRYEDMDFRSTDLAVRSRSDGDLLISVLPSHRFPPLQRTCHPLRLLHPLRRIFGIRIANGTPHDVTLTQSIPHLFSDGRVSNDLYAHQDLAIDDLCKRIRHLVGTCDHHSIFTNKELWFKRARGCTETVASLVFCANIKPELFGDLKKLLFSLSHFLEGDYMTTPGSDGLFRARYYCLTFVVVNRGLANHDGIKLDASLAIDSLSRFGMEDGDKQTNDGTIDENALRNARRIDNYFETAKQFCVYGLRGVFRPSEVGITEEQVKEVLARHEDDISLLERIALAEDQVANIDRSISKINGHLCAFTRGLIGAVGGVHFDKFTQTEFIQPIQFSNPTSFTNFLPQFIFLHQRLGLLCSYSSKLRDIVDGRGKGSYEELIQSLGTLWRDLDDPKHKFSGVRRQHLMERQLWRLQDLRDGGGFGFWVELFFLVVTQLVLILSPDTHSSLVLGTFRTITYNWRQHKHSIGTQRVILNLICDLAIIDRGLLSNHVFPSYIADELLVLSKNMVEGQPGLHVDEAMKELENAIKEQDAEPEWSTEIRLFRAKAVKVISRSRAPTPSS